MEELSVDMTYATALFEAAGDVGKTEQIQSESAEVLKTMEDNPELGKFFVMPGIPADEKKEVIKDIFADQISPELLHFLYILIDKGRVRHLARIVKGYDHLMDKANGLATGSVYSAVPLTQEQLSRLTEQTGRLMGEKVRLENQVDKSLIGGIKVMIDGKIFDASIKKRLEDMKERMRRQARAE